MFDRTPEESLFDTLGMEGIGSIVFSPLAQGMLTDRYLSGSAPKGSRAAKNHFLKETQIDPNYLERAKGLNAIAAARGQSLAQMAVAWVLRHRGMSSALIGASKPAQITELVGALQNLHFSADELAAIDQHAVDGGINLWKKPSTDQRI